MDYLWIVYIVVSVLVMYLLVKLFKKAFKIAIIVLIAMVALSVFFGYPVFDDFMDVQDNLASSSKLFLLQDNGNIIAGFDGEMDGDKIPTAIDKLDEMNIAYADNFEALEYKYYKTFVTNIEIFKDNENSIEIGQLTISSNEVIAMIKSDNTLDEFVKFLILDDGKETTPANMIEVKNSLSDNNGINTNNEMKGMLFMALFASEQIEDNFFLFRQLRKGNIEVFPRTAFFKALDLIPEFIIERVPTKWESLTGLQNEKKTTTSSP